VENSQVVDKMTVWNGEYAAVNSFGIGGTNSHLILKRYKKQKAIHRNICIPRLMVVSGRTEASVKALLIKVSSVGSNSANENIAIYLYAILRRSKCNTIMNFAPS